MYDKPNHPQPSETNLRTVNSEELFQGDREIRINHNGEIYRMRITKADKLILNK